MIFSVTFLYHLVLLYIYVLNIYNVAVLFLQTKLLLESLGKKVKLSQMITPISRF